MLRLPILIFPFTNIVSTYQDHRLVRKPGGFRIMCPRCQASHQAFPNQDYTCKPAPGGRLLKCKDYVMDTELLFRCPQKGYIRGYSQDVGELNRMQCCTKPGLYYSEQNCANHFNSDINNSQMYTVYEGKFVTGFISNDDRKTWTATECGYNC